MTAGEEREALAKFADRLCAELSCSAGDDDPDEALSQSSETRPRLFGELLGPENERLIATARRSLARIAAALGADHPKAVSETTYRALLDGAEFVMRGELVAGNPVSALMPSFVFLIALPMLEQDEALALSRRTSSLLGQKTI